MREIKFRAWDKKRNRWVYVYLRPHGKIYLPNAYTTISFPSYDGIVQLVDCEEWYQFTGLKDKNGVDVYEGDIVKWNDGDISLITFDHGAFCFKDRWESNWTIGGWWRKFEVIGNVWENSELLEADNET